MKPLKVTIDAAARRADEFARLLRALVTTESPTGDEAANLAVAAILEEAIVGAGGRVEHVPAPGLGVHLLGRFRGVGGGGVDGGGADGSAVAGSGRAPLLVLGHMDTVHPVGTLERLPFERREGRIGGPGIYDMKSGLTAAIVALGALAEANGGPGSDVSLLITCDEERGSGSSRELIEAEARRSRAALVVEPSVPGGGVKSRRKGVGAYVLNVAGKAAHAGIEPEAGASAVHEIARQICWMCDLGDADAGTTVNVGVVSGGTVENVVADSARCTIDVRFWTSGEAKRVDAALRRAKPFDGRCALRLDGGVNRGPLEKTPESAELLGRAREFAAELGFELGEGRTGGGSDGNIASAAGCPTLDGLGPDGGGAHTLDEHIVEADIPRRIALMAALLERL